MGIIVTFPVGSSTAPTNDAPGKNEFEKLVVKGLYVPIFDVVFRGVKTTFPFGSKTGEVYEPAVIEVPTGTIAEYNPVKGLYIPTLL